MPRKNNKRTVISLVSMLLATTAVTPVFAQETQPYAACAAGEEGAFRRAANGSGPVTGQRFLFCDGANWIPFLFYDHPTESLFFRAPAAAPADITFSSSHWTLWLDEASNEFELKAKKSDGTIISTTVGSGGSSLWTDDTSHISYQSAHIIKSGQTLPAVMDDNGTRMFFYPDKAAFRGGRIVGGNDAWQDANIGGGSFAWGENVEASGGESVAMGGYSTASGFQSTALGSAATASGAYSVALGRSITASGQGSVALGYGSTASADDSIAIGLASTASNVGSIVLGHRAKSEGIYSMAIGLGNSGPGNYPRVTGDNSFGIFMGYQADANITANNRMALVGGDFMIDDNGAAGSQGCLRYVNGTGLQYSDDCSTWTAFNAIGGGSGLWTDNTSYISYQSAHIINPGQALPAVLDDYGTRMFFYPDKGAFRGGHVGSTNDAWEDANIGTNSLAWGANVEANAQSSVAMGYDNTASGNSSVAMGYGTTASGDYSFAIGIYNTASGSESVAMGYSALASGNLGSVAMGYRSTASSYGSIAMGYGASSSAKGAVALGFGTASGQYSLGAGDSIASGAYSFGVGGGSTASGQSSVAMGQQSVASGGESVAMGREAVASGQFSIALGREVIAGNGTAGSGFGDYSMAIGLGASGAGNDPRVTGDSSLGIFMGDQTDADISTNNVMALVGGHFMIDDAGASGSQGCLRYVNGTGLQYSDDCSTWTAFNTLGGGSGLWTDNTSHISYQSTHIIKSGQALPAVMDDNGTRMFFYPDKAAFRGGTISSANDAWQDGNTGTNSFAWGINTQAGGNYSVAMGGYNTTTKWGSVAMGVQNTSSGYYSFAMGHYVTASGGGSVAMGYQNTASGTNSVALGFYTTANGTQSFAVGDNATASGSRSIAMGYYSAASGWSSIALGRDGVASGLYSVSIGYSSDATDDNTVAIGYKNTASNNFSVAMGERSTASGWGSTAMGYQATASGAWGVAIGSRLTAGGQYSTALGVKTIASGLHSLAMGKEATAGSGTGGDGAGDGSMAFGLQTAAQATDPKITGDRTVAFFFDGNTANANSGVNITANDSFIIYGGKLSVGDTTPDVELDVVGDINYTGVLADVSDLRLKTEINDLPEGQLEKVIRLKGVSFKMKDNPEGPLEYGFIAQDVQTDYPHLVQEDKAGMLSLNYVGLIAPMAEAIEEQNDLIKTQEERIKALEEQILLLKAMVEEKTAE
ncbi:MAG: tail fiber domain-containing protein [Rhodospirillales bacterium]|nr:tail fiber domain-containing protein [Rhodospirillales bacterium]MCB9996067.1 tail fiber domain-containing protein [Rhodospirillales bacterium]